MKIKFRDVKLSKTNKRRLETINDIIEDYQRQEYTLTLRQLYYQLVSRDIIPNVAAEYNKLSILLKEGRMAGIVDWGAIEDRLRRPESPASFRNPQAILNAAINQYQLPRQKGQENYIEVWVEKDALSGVLKRVTGQYHIPILVNRGYSSASAMFDSFERFEEAYKNSQNIKILYLGDYDPSGLDMIRDIEKRIIEFFVGKFCEYEFCEDEIEYYTDQFNFEIKPIALTKKQIDLYEPPPNPAKLSDTRAAKFVQNHGYESWEVDALRPEILNQLLHDEITDLLNMDFYNGILLSEKKDIKKLKSLTKYL
jgi:hypothetical protein